MICLFFLLPSSWACADETCAETAHLGLLQLRSSTQSRRGSGYTMIEPSGAGHLEDQCEKLGMEVITTLEKCNEAAKALGLSDTTASNGINSPVHRAYGCVLYYRGGLNLNLNKYARERGTDSQGHAKQICENGQPEPEPSTTTVSADGELQITELPGGGCKEPNSAWLTKDKPYSPSQCAEACHDLGYSYFTIASGDQNCKCSHQCITQPDSHTAYQIHLIMPQSISGDVSTSPSAVTASAVFDVDASAQDTDMVTDSKSGLTFGCDWPPAPCPIGEDSDGVHFWDFSELPENKMTIIPGSPGLVEADEYTHAYVLKWKPENTAWRTLLKHTHASCATTKVKTNKLGTSVYPSYQFKESGYDIDPQEDYWQVLVVTGRNEGEPGKYEGTSTFYVPDSTGTMKQVGTTDGVCSHDTYQRIGWSRYPPGKLARVLAWDRVLSADEIQALASLEFKPLPDLEITELGVGSCALHSATSILREATYSELAGCKDACVRETECSYFSYGDADNSCVMLTGIPCELVAEPPGFVTYGKPTWFFEHTQ